MDSCHIFNFLFGTRKAASELRRCFAASSKSGGESAGGSGAIRANSAQKQQQKRKPPGSPLKQIQLKIINFASGGSISSVVVSDSGPPEESTGVPAVGGNVRDQLVTERAAADGTYKATLVQLPFEVDELKDENNNHVKEEIQPDGGRETISNGSSQRKSSSTVVKVYDNPCESLSMQSEDAAVRVHHHYDRVDLDRAAAEKIRSNEQEDEAQDNSQTRGSTTSERVRSLVRSFESQDGDSSATLLAPEVGSRAHRRPSSGGNRDTPDQPPTPGRNVRVAWPPKPNGNSNNAAGNRQPKPTTIVKPLPPATPPKSKRVKCFNWQLTLNKPCRIEQLFLEENFLRRHFFDKLEPLDRCSAAQVCRQWRDILYANQAYWRDLVGVIDCTQLRREHLLECIENTLQSARLKQAGANGGDMDEDEIWRIQELCNRYARGAGGNSALAGSAASGQRSLITTAGAAGHTHEHSQQNSGHEQQQQQQQQQTCLANSKSSSIPSQISSTLSSVSISSLLSPLSETSRVDSIRERLYAALDERGFDAICLFGATDDDIEELICKTRPNGVQARVRLGRLNNCPLSDRGLELFVSTFNKLEELELTGCNELTNNLPLKPLVQMRRLIITDCINIADGLAQRLIEILHQLDVLIVQAYHLTDAFLEFISLNSDTGRLRRLELPNCKEITNNSMLTIAKHFPGLEALSISGSTKISDDGLEILSEHARALRSLDLSWCTKITDVTLECVACDLSANLSELILDRNMHITDVGLGYLATMSHLELLYIRWCPRITDLGLESVLTMGTLRRLSLAGLRQLTARGLLCLAEATQLVEVELTNCPAVNSDLMQFLRTRMPKCNIIF